MVDFLPFFTRATTFATSCLLSCALIFWEGVYSTRKEFAPKGTKFFLYGEDSLLQGDKTILTSPVHYLFPLNRYCFTFYQNSMYNIENVLTRSELPYLSSLFFGQFEKLHILPIGVSKYCWVRGKQCWTWSDAAFCGIWSGSTLFVQACLPIA